MCWTYDDTFGAINIFQKFIIDDHVVHRIHTETITNIEPKQKYENYTQLSTANNEIQLRPDLLK